mmetsp:Transcript_1349/g.5493  ORF Transcript_1349/g.5493 Transcript_1349/m.5493 type:complete len:231 (-) Transcript_1349:960-1652(-)
MLASLRRSSGIARGLVRSYRATAPAASDPSKVNLHPGDFPEAHPKEGLDHGKSNIGLKRLVDISLRQDLSFQKARTWDDAKADDFAKTAVTAYLKGRKVVIFGVPGAFTGVCTNAHVPEYVKAYDSFKELGVDSVACISVNDPYTVKAWASSMPGAEGKIEFLADPSGAWTRMLGLEKDLSGAALSHRSNRYSMYIEDGQLIAINVEDAPSDFDKSAPAALVEQIKNKAT